MRNILLSILIGGLLVFNGCETTSSTSDASTTAVTTVVTSTAEKDLINALPLIKIGASGLATVAINYGVSDSDKVVKCQCIYGLAHALYITTGGSLPTPVDLQNILQTFAVSDGLVYTELITYLTDLYASYYAKIGGDVKLGVLVLNALAGGLEQAAAKYIPPVPQT